jgi:hypothetical protein
MSGFLCSMVGVSSAAAAVVNNAVSFDGTNDFYQVTGLTTTATDSKYLTIAFTWFHASGANSINQNFMTARLGTTSGENGWEVCLQSGRFRYSAPNNSGSDTDMVYGDAQHTNENAWNQMVAYIDHTSFANCKWYVNGVDRTSSLLNGAAIGAVNLANVNLNWGSSNVTIKIGEDLPAFPGTSGFSDFVGRISQIYVHNASGAPTIGNYWNTTSNLPLDLGTNGTATGLAQPLIYHYGTTSTFPTNNGTGFNAYTLTATGNVASAEGPTFGIKLPTGVEFQRSSGERIRVASLGSLPSNSKAWVASAWYKPASLVTSGTHAMFGTTQTIDGNSPIAFEITGSSTINGYGHFLSGAANIDATFTPGFTVGTWYHIVFRLNGTNSGRTQCWVNGVRYLDIAADNYAQNLPHASTADFGMGARSMSTLYTAHCLDGCLAQVWVYAADYDIETNITKFYNNGLVDFGSAGTSSGLPTPHFYHKGSTQATFDDINGSVTGTATVTGTLSTCS